jgi:hypothetical protein
LQCSYGTAKHGRLQLDYPTITATDLLLEKLQIHAISQKDLKDIIVLLRAHDLGDVDDSILINTKHLADVLAVDWGFWKDCTLNLHDVEIYADKYRSEGALPENDFNDVTTKIRKILDIIENQPKTERWKLRARTGESKQWWNRVEEVSR